MPGQASRPLWVSALAFLAVACTDATAPALEPEFAASALRDLAQVDFHHYQWVECANGGDGEDVELTGTLHVLERTTTDGNGTVHSQKHFQPMGIEGLGMETGGMWRGTGVTRTTWNEVPGGGPEVETFVMNYKIIGTAGHPSLMWHVTAHLTTGAGGDVRADVFTETLECF